MNILGSLGIGGMAGSWLGIFVWLGLGILFLLFIGGGAIWIRRHKKLIIPTFEVICVGNGKTSINTMMSGWFRSKWILGLIDYSGEQKLLTKDKREIQHASSEDFQTINGKLGIVVQRKGDDPKMLFPIKRIELDEESEKLICQVAPADYRDASVKEIQQAERETMSKLAQYLPFITFGVVFILSIIVIIFVIQYVKGAQSEAWQYTQEAIKTRGSSIVSSAPLLFPFLFRRRK